MEPLIAPKIAAVLVTFEPEPERLRQAISQLVPQVDALVVVDNGSKAPPTLQSDPATRAKTHWIGLPGNRGIAAAQNLGIDWARDRGFEYVLLSDQDSHAAPDMVRHLVVTARRLAAEDVSVALLAPDYVDERQSIQIPFMDIVEGRPRWFGCLHDDGTVEITTAIASGSLIPMATLEAVGGMREAMFIDLVDIEWCFRARARGYRAFGVCRAKLVHSIGDEPTRILGRTLATHCPLRNYYFYRNAVWLFRQTYVPACWKQVVGAQMLKRFVVFSVFVAPRIDYFRHMVLGIWHGLKDRSGPL